MLNPPLFFRLHGLAADADERAIKRAYAKSLKKIDQETDLQSFQALRESYETALSWIQFRDRYQAHRHASEIDARPEVEQATINEIALVVEPVAVNDATVGPQPLREEIISQASKVQGAKDEAGGLLTPEKTDEVQLGSGDTERLSAPDLVSEVSAAPEEVVEPLISEEVIEAQISTVEAEKLLTPEEVAAAVFDELLVAMHEHAKEAAFAENKLLQLLEDLRLFHMETRLHFERLLADYLLQGWQPGNGELFDAVVQSFGWEKDRRRLLNLGRPGHILDRALTEAIGYLDKDKNARKKQWQLVIKIRETDSPSQSQLKANLGLLQRMQDLYPTWLRLMTKPDHLEKWRDQAGVLQDDLARKNMQFKSENVDVISRPMYWMLTMIFILFIIGKFYSSDRSLSGSQANAPKLFLGLQDPQLSTQQKIQKAETLLRLSGDKKEKIDEAIHLLENAANEGSGEAARRLSRLYSEGTFVNRDVVKQYDWILKAAERGDLLARVMVGDYFLDGQGGKVNHKEALRHFKIAADKGNSLGQFKLAFMIDHGFGTKKNKAEVARLIKASADQGFAYSESLMGQFYLRGEYGMTRDELKAANWFSLSAKHGDSSGENYFGLVHEQGLGSYKINLGEAASWYGKARAHGDKKAEENLLRLCKKSAFPECRLAPVLQNLKPVLLQSTGS